MLKANRFATWTAVSTLTWTLLAARAPAAAAPFVLELTPESNYQSGCFPPCLCPIQIVEGLRGTLTFELAEQGRLFTNYDVTADLTVPGDPPRSLVGVGVFSVGGDIALIHQLVLDLSLDGAKSEHFQGTKVGGGPFPDRLDITVSIGQQECVDTVLDLHAAPASPGSGGFVRGDCNADGAIDISDAVSGLLFLFGGGERPPCLDACDANDDGKQDISDAVTTLSFLFLGGDPLPEPTLGCGADPTADLLECDAFPQCAGSCDEEIASIAEETQIVGSCSAVVRLDYLTRRLLGWQLLCGQYAAVTEETAREQGETDTGYGGGHRLSPEGSVKDAYVFYEPPGDFGGASVVSARTGLSVFGGSIVWLGRGDITYPTEWRGAETPGTDCPRFDGDLPIAGYDLADGSAGLAPGDMEAALEVVRTTAILHGMATSGYVFDAVVILYPRSVGAFDPATAEWIVIVNGGWLE